MQMKITVAGLSVVALLALTPVMQADPVPVPAKYAFDRVGTVTSVLTTSEFAIPSFTFVPDRDRDRDPMPEPSSMVPLILLAAGGWLVLRKRLIPTN